MPPIPWIEADRLAWVGCRLVEESVKSELLARLRLECGLVYTVDCRLVRQAEMGLLEIETSCLPQDGPRVHSLLRSVLETLSTTGIQSRTLERAKLALSGELAQQLEDPRLAMAMLADAARHSRPTADPLGELQDIGLDTIAACIQRWILPNACAFSVTGPLLEDDIEKYALDAAVLPPH